MREILFRGKTEEGEWVYGSYSPFSYKTYFMNDYPQADQVARDKKWKEYIGKRGTILEDSGLQLDHAISEETVSYDSYVEFIQHIVLKETVGQYTYCHERRNPNSKFRIFEGDIIEVERPRSTHKCRVVWHVGMNTFSVTLNNIMSEEGVPYMKLLGVSEVELNSKIIGNIHDNPELLEDQS